jgi:hypothetical protein
MKVILLPSTPLSSFKKFIDEKTPFIVQFIPISFDQLKTELSNNEIISYIRHKPTAELLKKYFNIKEIQGEYIYDENDMIYVISSPIRPTKSGEDVQLKENDLLIVRIIVARGIWI